MQESLVWFPGWEDPWGSDRLLTPLFLGFPGGSDGKEFASSEWDLGSMPGTGRSPGGGHGNPLHCSCLENLHGQKHLAGHSPQGHKEPRIRRNPERKHRTARCVYANPNPQLTPLPSPLLLLLLSHLGHVRLCATPSLGFSRQEHWGGVPLPSPPLPFSNHTFVFYVCGSIFVLWISSFLSFF